MNVISKYILIISSQLYQLYPLPLVWSLDWSTAMRTQPLMADTLMQGRLGLCTTLYSCTVSVQLCTNIKSHGSTISACDGLTGLTQQPLTTGEKELQRENGHEMSLPSFCSHSSLFSLNSREQSSSYMTLSGLILLLAWMLQPSDDFKSIYLRSNRFWIVESVIVGRDQEVNVMFG